MDLINLLHILENNNENMEIERIFRDRANPFDAYSDEVFQNRYRFSKVSVIFLINELSENIQRPTERNKSISPELQVRNIIHTYNINYVAHNNCGYLCNITYAYYNGKLINDNILQYK